MAPDLDWFVAFVNVHKNPLFNHRGAAHSLFAALLIAAAVLVFGFPKAHRRGRIWLCLTLAAVSHGLLDACTSGGVGVALFLPFSHSRWACVWQPIQVAPLPLSAEHTYLFLGSLWDEAFWIGLPILGVLAYARLRHLAKPAATLALEEASD
jgi:inner membrane protein